MKESSFDEGTLDPAIANDLSYAPDTDQSLNSSDTNYPSFEGDARKNDDMQRFEQIRKKMKDPIRIQDVPQDGVVYYSELSDTTSFAYESIVKIGLTTKTIAGRQRRLKRCLPNRTLGLANEFSHRRSLFYERLKELVILTLDAYRLRFRCHSCENGTGGCRNHEEFFAVSPELALSIIDLWHTWLDDNPYAASGKLSASWQRRLDEARAELRDDFDLQVVLRLMLRPLSEPQPLAQELRNDPVASNNTTQLPCDGDQELDAHSSEVHNREDLCQDITNGPMQVNWPLRLKGCSRVVLPLVLPLAWVCTLSWLNHMTLCKTFIWLLRFGGWVMTCFETSCRIMFWLFRFEGQVLSLVEAMFVFATRY